MLPNGVEISGYTQSREYACFDAGEERGRRYRVRDEVLVGPRRNSIDLSLVRCTTQTCLGSGTERTPRVWSVGPARLD